MQPGIGRLSSEPYHKGCEELAKIARQIQEWVQLDETEFEANFGLTGDNITTVEPAPLSKTRESHIDPSTLSSSKDAVAKISYFESYLSAFSSIIFSGYIGAFVEVVSSHRDNDPIKLICDLRKYCRGEEFEKKQKSVARRERKAHRSHVEWLNTLLYEHKTLQVAHLILASNPHGFLSRNAFNTLIEKREKFLNYMRKKDEIFTGCVGYLWRIFSNPLNGHRLMIVLLIDPYHCKADANEIASTVGDFWYRKVTNKQGAALSQSFALKHLKSESRGKAAPSPQVGMVRHDNPQDIARLQSLINHLSTLDLFGYYAPIPSDTDKKRQLPRSQGNGESPWRKKAMRPSNSDLNEDLAER